MAGMNQPNDLMTTFVTTLDELERAILLFDVDDVSLLKGELIRLYDELRREVGALHERTELEERMKHFWEEGRHT